MKRFTGCRVHVAGYGEKKLTDTARKTEWEEVRDRNEATGRHVKERKTK
jgi:hypothetical protein